MNYKKRTFSKLIFTSFLIGILSLSAYHSVNIYANSVPVEYDQEESQNFPIEVKVSGPGKVSADKFQVTSDKKDYPLPVDEKVTFKIIPEEDGEIKTVVLNEEKDAEAIQTGTITVNGAEKKQMLEVKFVSDVSPLTGLKAQYLFYFFFFIVSAIIFVSIVRTLKDIKEESR